MAYKKKVVKKKGGSQSGFADILGQLTQGSLLGLFSGSKGVIPGMPGTSSNSPKKKVTIKKKQ